MNIAIIGAGNIGSGLARTFAAAGNTVAIASRTEKDARALAEKLAAEGIDVRAADIAGAVAPAEVVILAVPFSAAADVAGRADFTGKIVVDVTNPLAEDFSGITVGFDTSAGEEIQKTFPEASVVKAFNTVFAQIYEQGLDFNGRRVPAFVAADRADAKAAVVALAEGAGFDAVDAGGLTNARYIEPLAYLNIQFAYMLGQGDQITPAWLSR